MGPFEEEFLCIRIGVHCRHLNDKQVREVLWISVGSLCWKWSEEFSIDKEGMLIVELDSNISAIIRIKQLSSFQKRVIIDGQFKIHSQLSYPIQIRCEFPTFVPDESKVTNLLLTKSLAPRRSSPAFLLSAEQCKSMHLSITGILDSQIWSESICVGGNILLEIPFETAGKYQSVWCQVLERKISSTSNYIAVFISPLFTLRSNLPMPVTVEVSSEDQEEMYEIELIGQGHESNLFKSSNKQNRLQLNFQSKTEGDFFRDRIGTVDMMWVSHISPEGVPMT
ncbi:vacuolar protein sorting-associated protein 13B [Trichonephila clavipes]|nr:vacuolar protein sorting-associated protein 13B [Trichonephila clavipes]